MSFATGGDAKTLSYPSAAGAVQVELQGGKVTSVEKPKVSGTSRGQAAPSS